MGGEEETLTRADARAYLRRFPAQGVWQVAFNLLLVFGGNAIVLYLLLSGRMRAAHLIVLVAVEAVLLIVIAALSTVGVPPGDRFEKPMPWRERLPTLLFGVFWIAGVYAITLVFIHGWPDLFALLRSADAWFVAGLFVPIAYTAGTALLQAGADRVHYRRHGRPFISGVAGPLLARILTLVLGGVPFAMPFFVAVFGAVKGVEFVLRKARVRPAQSVLAGVGMPVIAYGAFALVGVLIEQDVAGWAIGFVLAKLIAESMVAAIPLVMNHVANEPETVAAG
jgi:hypothetical protein